MKKIFSFFIDNYRFTVVMTVLIVLFGVIGLSIIKREDIPPVNFAVVTITTNYPGSSPEEVDEKITKKIEDEIVELILLCRHTVLFDPSEEPP